MARNSNNRKGSGKKSYSILVDGQTEVWYFQLMKQYEDFPRIDIKPELQQKTTMERLFDLAEENAKDYDLVLMLFDLDAIIHDGKESEFREKVIKYKDHKIINIYINNPCLEFWFLLHFHETSRQFTQCCDVETELKKNELLKDYQKTQKYYKNHRNNIYKKLQPYQNEAIKNATRLGDFDFHNIHQSKAEIYKIFNILQNP